MRRFTESFGRRGRWPIPLLALLVTTLAYFSYVHGYWNPPHLFWDENYHIASAQRYLNGTFFMEPHPPLGKLFIALGEFIVSPEANGAADQFVATDHAPETPVGFSFVGYRLFPTLFAWLIVPMLFSIFLLLTKSQVLAALLTVPYLFDNAMIVHSRSAMLEPTLEFFAVAMILLFLLLLKWRTDRGRVGLYSLLFGACFAAVLTTKVNGLVMGVLYLPLLWKLFQVGDSRRTIRDTLAFSALGFLLVFVGVWHTHFALASNINRSLPGEGYYQASDEYKGILGAGENASIVHFPVMLRDSMAFVAHYQRGVPKLDLCKSGEDGSPWFFWPIGARAINYRWETPGGGDTAPYRYLYLQSNPAGWFFGFLGVVMAGMLVVGSLVVGWRLPLKNRFMLTVFLGLWVAYMAAISQLDRVMYLYHYFIPLLFSYILFGLAFSEIGQIGSWKMTDHRRMMALALCAVAVFGSYCFYRPLTYYEPITDAEFQKRSLIRLWDLHCARCDLTSPLTRGTCS
ncbi:MAG: phospholipid carrier-dependent glycosyltransferase [Thermoanaerobaculia bacterium]